MTTKSSIICDQNLPAVRLSKMEEAAWFTRLHDRQNQSLNPLHAYSARGNYSQ